MQTGLRHGNGYDQSGNLDRLAVHERGSVLIHNQNSKQMELIRYFSFPYCFFDTKVRRTRYGIWGFESAAGFPSAGDVIKDIDNYLTGKGGLVVTEVRLTGWQEFQNENDYRNFTN